MDSVSSSPKPSEGDGYEALLIAAQIISEREKTPAVQVIDPEPVIPCPRDNTASVTSPIPELQFSTPSEKFVVEREITRFESPAVATGCSKSTADTSQQPSTSSLFEAEKKRIKHDSKNAASKVSHAKRKERDRYMEDRKNELILENERLRKRVKLLEAEKTDLSNRLAAHLKTTFLRTTQHNK